MKQESIVIPEGCREVLLHACCAPCSSAIVEWLMAHDVRPTIFYFNPNIYPREEYEIRKAESKRHADSLGLRWIDGDYDHRQWRSSVAGLECEPERGRRCQLCFTLRLTAAARKARELGLRYFATTLASSRWKSLEQIEEAGRRAVETVGDVSFWAQNWRKGGLQERRNQLLREKQFYNQLYCGCEFSVPPAALTKPLLRAQMREAKRQHLEQLPALSAAITAKLRERLANSRTVLAFWPLSDEPDLRPLLLELAAKGITVLLPKVVDDERIELRRFASTADLVEGAFHIQEPVGEPFTNISQIDLALIPGMAFDAAGRRLGRGRGYYDRFLQANPSLYKIGVAFPFQHVSQVPVDEHDVLMDETC